MHTVAVTFLCSEDLAEYTAALSVFKLSDVLRLRNVGVTGNYIPEANKQSD